MQHQWPKSMWPHGRNPIIAVECKCSDCSYSQFFYGREAGMTKHINIQYHKTKIGDIVLGSFDNKLCLLDFRYRKMRKTVDNRLKRGLNAEFMEQDDALITETKKQIDEYLQGNRGEFNVPILTIGTEFQKVVWDALLKVPFGTTSTYAQLAKDIKNEKAVRAVANANGANAIAVIIPCHRIIETGGCLGGYGGGLVVKKRLLKIEQANK